jgi:hypothetical protein
MTVSDWLRELPDYPGCFQTPAGPMRVIGVFARGRCLPFVRCVTERGAVVEWAALYSTELEEFNHANI